MNDTIDQTDQRQALDRYDPNAVRSETRVGDIAVIHERDLSMNDSTYVDMSQRPVTPEQADILNRDLPDEDIDIRPDGAIFMSHARLRRRLNEAFRPGGWALRRLTPIHSSEPTANQNKIDLVLSAEYALYAEGRFLSAARGEQKYQDNGEMTYGDAVEGLKSNALSRCCKDLGIALDLWDRAFADRWRERHCVKVWREGSRKPQWRRADALPFYDESGISADSPNQDRYVALNGRRSQPQQEQRRQETRPDPQRPSQQHQQAAPPPQRQREPGDDDEPVQQPAGPPQRPAGNGRKISDAQGKRLYMKATNSGGMSKDQYRDFLRKWGYDSDRDVMVSDYDQMVAEAEVGAQ